MALQSQSQKKIGTPKEVPVLTDGPAPAAGFANKQMVVALTFGAAVGTKPHGAEASPIQSDVKVAMASGLKNGSGSFGSFGTIGLH
jgi:hypothetical protein